MNSQESEPANDMTDVCDRIQDCSRELQKLSKAITGNPNIAPTINVAAPNVAVGSPVVTTPVTVIEPMVKLWTFDVTARDANGYIKSFTATPLTV